MPRSVVWLFGVAGLAGSLGACGKVDCGSLSSGAGEAAGGCRDCTRAEGGAPETLGGAGAATAGAAVAGGQGGDVGGAAGDGAAGEPSMLPLDCSVTPPCAPGFACSRLFDVGSSEPVQGAFQFQIFGWSPFPDGLPAMPIRATSVNTDACGRFALELPQNTGLMGQVVVVVDPEGKRVPTGSKFLPDLPAIFPALFSLKAADAARWSEALAVDDVLAAAPILLIYADKGSATYDATAWQPYAGVAVRYNEMPVASHYFADTNPQARLELVEGGPTGPDGSALVLGNSGASFTGSTTTLKPGCHVWSAGVFFSAPGALMVGVRTPVCE